MNGPRPPQTGAYVGHDGRLVAICMCGQTFSATTDKAALVALFEHQKYCGQSRGTE